MKILHGLLEFLDINQFTEFVSQHISPCRGPVKGGSGDRLVKQLFFFHSLACSSAMVTSFRRKLFFMIVIGVIPCWNLLTSRENLWIYFSILLAEFPFFEPSREYFT
jgi:hypothetical protein